MSSLIDIFSLASKSFCKSRLMYFKLHSLSIVASSTTNRVYYFATPLVPRSAIVFFQTYFLHQARHIRAFTSPTSTWLRRVGRVGRCSCTEDLGNILYGMHMPTWCIILLRESITSPEHNHFRTLRKHIIILTTHVLGLESCVSSRFPRIILTWVELSIELIATLLVFQIVSSLSDELGLMRPIHYRISQQS